MTDMHGWEYAGHDAQYPAPADGDFQVFTDVPSHSDILPDGTPTLVIGDPEGEAQFNHQQGDNPYGFQEDCGLVSTQDILNQFGVSVTEGDVVQHAFENGECNFNPGDPSASGGTTADQRVQILSEYGIPAHVEEHGTFESLLAHIQNGQGCIISVNAGSLWHDPQYFQNGQHNHAIVVTGVARDPQTGQIQGFYINDSGDGKSAEFVDAKTLEEAWVNAGGEDVVTDVTHQ
jgi:hypothetical protein